MAPLPLPGHAHTIMLYPIAQTISATEPRPLFYGDGDEDANPDCTWGSTAPAKTNAPSPAPWLYTCAGMSSGSPLEAGPFNFRRSGWQAASTRG